MNVYTPMVITKLIKQCLLAISLMIGFSSAVIADEAVIKPVKLYQVPDLEQNHSDSFIARIDAGERSKLSFQVPGIVQHINVRKGQHVAKGDLLASLDSTDYKLAVEVSQAHFDLAKISFLRDQELIKKKLISAETYDKSATNYKAAQAQLEQTKTNLKYTNIIAPFDGIISLKFIREHEFANANQAIVNILNNEKWEVVFSLPVPYVEHIGVTQLEALSFQVRLDNHSQTAIKAELIEMSPKPSSETNSYTAKVAINNPKGAKILTGMNARVDIESKNKNIKKPSLYLPYGAINIRSDGSQFVWRFNPESQSVESVKVTVNQLGAISNGLSSGDQIVIAGTQYLTEGLRVRAWKREAGI